MNEIEKMIGKFLTTAYERDLIQESDIDELLAFARGYSTWQDIWEFGTYYFPDRFYLPFNDMHRYLWDTHDQRVTSTISHRGSAKTSISCFLIPIYMALFDKRYKFYLFVQDTSRKASMINKTVRDAFMYNDKLIGDFGYLIDERTNQEKLFRLKNGVWVGCAGAEESIRGLNASGLRPDYVICDDIYSEDCFNSPDQIEKRNCWLKSVIFPCVNQQHSSIHLLGTKFSNADIFAEMSKNPDVISKEFKATDETGKHLWLTDDQLKEKKNLLGSIVFNREYLGNLLDSETSIIKQSWIQYYDQLPEIDEIDEIVITIDPAISSKESADFTGKAVIAKDSHHNFYVIDIMEDRLSFNANIEHIKKLSEKYNPRTIKIESVSAFQVFCQELKRTTRLPVREVSVSKDKDTRLINISHLFENGKVLFSKEINHETMQTIIEQLCSRRPRHDDMRDAIVLGLEQEKNGIIGIA